MLKKILSTAAALCLMCASVVPAAMAAESSFSDMSASQYGWAIDDVESMTRLGIIKGYTDGTFKPANAIRKIEMLLLLSRVAGYTNDDYSPYTGYATAIYAPTLAGYDLGDTYNRYKPEVSFLLYKGIIKPEELDSLLGQAGTAIKRYEAAVLLTKVMGAEEQVRKNIAVALDYDDYGEIPTSARAYVEYVTEQGLMNGTGQNKFGPNENITRAQAAVILSRIISKLNYSTVYGTLSSKDTEAGTVNIYRGDAGADITVRTNSATKYMVDGKSVSLAALPNGSRVLALYSGSSTVSIEALTSPGGSETYAGILTDANIGEDSITLFMDDLSTGSERSFVLVPDENPKITLEGKACTFDDLHKDLVAVVTALDGKIISLDASSAAASGSGVSGVISDIQLSPEFILSVLVDDETNDYFVAADVSVTRNGKSASLRSLLVGDEVRLTEDDGIVTAIEATSSSSTASGVVTSIVIESNPKLTVRTGASDKVYAIAPDVEVEIDGSEAELYDLRLGSFVELRLDSSSIVYINVTSDPSSSTFQISGYIVDYNLSYGYVNIDTGDEVQQVFMNMTSGGSLSTAVIDASDGEKMRPSDLEVGQRVTAIGTTFNGVSTANTIVVIPE